MKEVQGIVSAAEVRGLVEAQSWTEPERVVLPKSGFALMLRKPTRWYWMLRRAEWPVDMREQIDAAAGKGEADTLSKDVITLWLKEQDAMAIQAFVQPKASANPDFNSIDPRWLPDEDREFIRMYLGGQVDANGVGLGTFSGSESGNAADGGPAGAEVRQVADGSAATQPVGVAG